MKTLMYPLVMIALLSIPTPLDGGENPAETITFQGVLTDEAAPHANGSYFLEFRLFAELEGGTPIEVLTDVPVTLMDGLLPQRSRSIYQPLSTAARVIWKPRYAFRRGASMRR